MVDKVGFYGDSMGFYSDVMGSIVFIVMSWEIYGMYPIVTLW